MLYLRLCVFRTLCDVVTLETFLNSYHNEYDDYVLQNHVLIEFSCICHCMTKKVISYSYRVLGMTNQSVCKVTLNTLWLINDNKNAS